MDMKRYELTFLMVPQVSKEETEEICEKISRFISEEGGSVEETRVPIKKSSPGLSLHKKADVFVGTVFFILSPEKTETLKQFLIQEKKIMRHMIVVKKIKEYSVKRPPKAELKEIDKKIDEILKISE